MAIPPSLVTSAGDFADYSLGRDASSTKRPMDDALLLEQWHDWAAAKNVAGSLTNAPCRSSTNDPVRVFLCHPVSNVLPSEKETINRLLHSISAGLAASGLPLEVHAPVLELGRHDQGPEIYLKRLTELRQTDLAIPLLDPPSTGVGIMLQLFHNATIPCLCVTKDWGTVSRMVRGLAPSQLDHVEVSSPSEAGPQIAKWLVAHFDEVRQARERRNEAWNAVQAVGIPRATALARIIDAPRRSMPLLRDEFLEHVIANPNLHGTITLLQLVYLAIAQEWSIVPSAAGFLALEPPIRLPPNTAQLHIAETAARVSLGALWEANSLRQQPVSEKRLAEVWSTYISELSPNAARAGKPARTAEDLTRSPEQWLRVLRAKEDF